MLSVPFATWRLKSYEVCLWEGLFLLLLCVHLVEPPPHLVGEGGGGVGEAHVHKI